MELTDAQFDQLISRAMDELPQQYITTLDNVAIVYADAPTTEQARQLELRHDTLLLGLYEGIPLPSRGNGYSFVLPDKITIFKQPLLAISSDKTDLFEHIKRTLWHEIAHYYGLDHDRIDSLQQQRS